jgi:hypothetical protein
MFDELDFGEVGGGRQNNGSAGLPWNCHPNYDGAFVIDPNGPNIMAVCHSPEA